MARIYEALLLEEHHSALYQHQHSVLAEPRTPEIGILNPGFVDQAPFFNCPGLNEDFGLVERGPAGPQKGDLPDESINIGLSVDPFRPMHVIHFPKAIICIYKPNQKLDGGG